MRRSSDRLILSGLLLLPEALSFEFNAVGVVDEAIKDCVGHGGVADDFVPAVDGQLAGDNDRASFISVLDNLKQITALVGVERLWPPVIKNEQIETSDSAQHLGVTAIGAAECEGGEETRHAMVRNCEVVSASLVAEGASEPALADAAWPGNEEIMSCPDPVASGSSDERRADGAPRSNKNALSTRSTRVEPSLNRKYLSELMAIARAVYSRSCEGKSTGAAKWLFHLALL